MKYRNEEATIMRSVAFWSVSGSDLFLRGYGRKRPCFNAKL